MGRSDQLLDKSELSPPCFLLWFGSLVADGLMQVTKVFGDKRFVGFGFIPQRLAITMAKRLAQCLNPGTFVRNYRFNISP